jgi:alpha/beta superfamily hydrolase
MYKSVELDVQGRLLRGVVRAPDTDGPFPTVIFYHGFTVDKVGMQRLHELFARRLVEEGFACVRFDFYGLGESDGDFVEMTLGKELEEAKAIHAWTKTQAFCAADQLSISGHSQGGLICTLIAPQLRPPAMILWSPALTQYYGVSLRARTMKGPTARGWDIEGLELSREFVEEIRKMDLRAMARGYNGPTLLIHGAQDELVPVDVVYEYQDIYGERMELVLIEGADHQYKSLPWKKAVYDHSVDFLKRQ